MLEDTADVEISLEKKTPEKVEKKETLDEYEKVDEDLEEIIENNKKDNIDDVEEDDDTLENDLFDLIDSMYEEEEEKE